MKEKEPQKIKEGVSLDFPLEAKSGESLGGLMLRALENEVFAFQGQIFISWNGATICVITNDVELYTFIMKNGHITLEHEAVQSLARSAYELKYQLKELDQEYAYEVQKYNEYQRKRAALMASILRR